VNAGYVEQNEIIRNSLGVPQGGTISPILANIYLHELDEYIDKLKAEYNTPGPISIKTDNFKKLSGKIRRAVNRHRKAPSIRTLLEIKNLRKERIAAPSVIRTGVKINYVRYADD